MCSHSIRSVARKARKRGDPLRRVRHVRWITSGHRGGVHVEAVLSGRTRTHRCRFWRPRQFRIQRRRSRTCFRSEERAGASTVPASLADIWGRTGWSPQTLRSSLAGSSSGILHRRCNNRKTGHAKAAVGSALQSAVGEFSVPVPSLDNA